MKRILAALLGGATMLATVSVSHAQIGFGLFDADRDAFVSPVEFSVGLESDRFFGGAGLFGIYDNDANGLLGIDEIEDRDEVYLRSYDLNNDYYLDRREYYGGLFSVYDENNDLFLDPVEFGVFGSDLGLFDSGLL